MLKFCSLFSGSTGNSLYVQNDNTKILIDSGVSCKKVIDALLTEKESEIRTTNTNNSLKNKLSFSFFLPPIVLFFFDSLPLSEKKQ